jgi:hypothetical protein
LAGAAPARRSARAVAPLLCGLGRKKTVRLFEYPKKSRSICISQRCGFLRFNEGAKERAKETQKIRLFSLASAAGLYYNKIVL